jgi:N-acetylmuramoyl-L-alanine amidase
LSKTRFFLRLVALLIFIPCLQGSEARAFSINQMRFGVHPEKTRLVLDMSAMSDFRVFVLQEPYRMVIDLPEFEWHAPPVGSVSQAGVRAVRYGRLKPGVSRIVFDLDRPVAVRTAFALPGQTGKPDRLVIDFNSVSQSVFNSEKTRVFGTLPVESAATAPSDQSYRTASLAQVAPPIPTPPLPPSKGRKPLIVIDPGHGGVDPGATGANRTFEKNVVLNLARELKKQLEDSGQYRVLMTRDSDVFIKLSDRVNFARTHEADLFVSIHADSIDKPGVRGSSVYTLSDKASDAQTEKLAARENRADLIAGVDLSTEDQDVANILVDLTMRDTMNQSRFFANKLVDTMRAQGINTLDTPHRYAGFAVLKAPDIPSILIEAGFMSNRQEAEMLNAPTHRRSLAGAIRRGIDAYFEQVRKNQRL